MLWLGDKLGEAHLAKKTTAALAAMFALIGTAAVAQIYTGPGTYQKIGPNTYGPNGTVQQSIGNNTYVTPGTGQPSAVYQHIGPMTYGSDGTTYQQVGPMNYGNNGTTSQTIGNNTFIRGQNGQTAVCQHIGAQIVCN